MSDQNEFSSYLPHIDVVDGKTRVMNQMTIYVRLLTKFKGRAMAAEVLEGMKSGDSTRVSLGAHALRGAAANLGFPTLKNLTDEIESLAKAGEDSSHLAEQLNEIMDALDAGIAKLIAL